jgi:putative transposase
MKQGRFSEEQIIAVLKEAEAGAKVTELCRRHGISDAAFSTWRKKYGGLEVSEMRRLRQLEEENRRLKAIVADQALDLRALKDVLAKNGYRLMFGPALSNTGSSDRPTVARSAGAQARAVLEEVILRGALSGVFAVAPENPPRSRPNRTLRLVRRTWANDVGDRPDSAGGPLGRRHD